MRFSWIALGVRDAKVFENLIDGLIIEAPDAPAPSAPSSPVASGEPSIEGEQEINNNENLYYISSEINETLV
jgi:hypothetical protein